MKKQHSQKEDYGLLDSPELDRRARESAKYHYTYTDQEIEELANQPKLNLYIQKDSIP